MTVIDLWAATASGIAAVAIGFRRYMLKPGLGDWASAPGIVQAALSALGIALAMNCLAIAASGGADAREASLLTVLAFVASVLLWNLHQNGRIEGLAAKLHGRAGLVMTVETRRDPETRAMFARGAARGEGRRSKS